MQKSAHISSIATRLNNLEQIVDGLEEPSGGGGSATDVARIVRNTFASATDGRSSKWQENQYFYDGRTDMSAMLWGPYFWYPDSYESCARTPLYQQIFGYSYKDEFGFSPPVSFASAVFGNRSSSTDFVKDFAQIGSSLAKSCFGSRDILNSLDSSLAELLVALQEHVRDSLLTINDRLDNIDASIRNLRSRVATLEGN